MHREARMSHWPIPPLLPQEYRRGHGGRLIEVGQDGMTDRERRLYERLCALAALGDPLPTNAELGEPLGVGEYTVGKLLKQLVRLGRIRSVGRTCGKRVEIVATGKRTAPVSRVYRRERLCPRAT